MGSQQGELSRAMRMFLALPFKISMLYRLEKSKHPKMPKTDRRSFWCVYVCPMQSVDLILLLVIYSLSMAATPLKFLIFPGIATIHG